MKSREAKKKAEEESRNQILQAFFATEQLRMEVQKKSLEVVMADSLTAMKKSLSMVDRKIMPVVQVVNWLKENVDYNSHQQRLGFEVGFYGPGENGS